MGWTRNWTVGRSSLEERLRRLSSHLSDAHTYVLKGQLKVRDDVLNAGDYDYEPNGTYGETKALEDTEYLFICDGPVLFFDDNGPTHYLSWLVRMRDAAAG